jgi:hypothetical protein
MEQHSSILIITSATVTHTTLEAELFMRKIKLLVSAAFLAIIFTTRSAHTSDMLNLTANSNKQFYVPNEVVFVNGSLMWVPHSIPVTDGVVGIEVRDPLGLPFIFRTRPTGTVTTQNWVVNFTQFYPCNSNGFPKYNFQRGETVYIFAEVKNFDKTLSHSAVICIVLYDANSVPLSVWYPASGSISPGGVSAVFFQSITLPTSAIPGSVTLYGSVFSDFPKNGGYPYCSERGATLTVITSQLPSQLATSKSALAPGSDGAYDLSFKFPLRGARAGSYTVYVSTYYYEVLVTNSFKFTFSLIGDTDGNGVVDIYDAIVLASAYNSVPGGPRWNSKADLNQDDIVDIYDAILLASHFGESAL